MDQVMHIEGSKCRRTETLPGLKVAIRISWLDSLGTKSREQTRDLNFFP
jgi:hypothetical protein